MFSGTVKLDDLNDYIKPQEECVVMKDDKISKDNDFDLPDLIKSKNQKAQISLDDCLACNGCITTSETLLIQDQSIQRLLAQIDSFDKKVALVSPQVI